MEELDRPAWVYFIYEVGDQTTYKVGYSEKPTQRLKNLQTGNKRELRIHTLIHCPDKRIAKQLEGSLHEYYLPKCQGGEWFALSPEDIEIIVAVAHHLLYNELPIFTFSDIMNKFTEV
jgi:hypothetical protein